MEATLDVVRDPNGGVIALLTGDGKVIPWSAGKADTTLNVSQQAPNRTVCFRRARIIRFAGLRAGLSSDVVERIDAAAVRGSASL